MYDGVVEHPVPGNFNRAGKNLFIRLDIRPAEHLCPAILIARAGKVVEVNDFGEMH
jgi:hypothetical protein